MGFHAAALHLIRDLFVRTRALAVYFVRPCNGWPTAAGIVYLSACMPPHVRVCVCVCVRLGQDGQDGSRQGLSRRSGSCQSAAADTTVRIFFIHKITKHNFDFIFLILNHYYLHSYAM